MKIRYQLDEKDCGPTCLAMIAEHYGRYYSLETLRELCNISKFGVSMLDISNAAENIGIRTIGGYVNFNNLVSSIALPCIVHWDQDHFVVVYNIKNNIVYVADPAKGLLEYSFKEFQHHWLSSINNSDEIGVVLVMEPTENFYLNNGEKKISVKSKSSFLFKYFFKYKKFFFQIALGLIVSSIIILIFPFLTQAIVDIGIGTQDINFIWLLLLGQLMMFFGKTAIDFIRNRLLLNIGSRINLSLISDFFIKLMKMPMSFFDSRLIGDLIQRIEDHKRIENFLTSQTLNLIFSVFSIFILSIILFIYNKIIFSVFIITSIIYIILILFFLKRRKDLDYKNFELQAINRSKTYQLINGMQEIKLQGCEKRKRWEWEDTQVDLFDNNLKNLSLKQTQEAGSIFINELKNILITVIAATAVINGNLTLGMMLSIQYIIGQLNSPIQQIMNFIYDWQDVGISIDRMNEIHNKDDEENKLRHVQKLPTKCDILINGLSFRYESSFNKNVLDDVTIEIPEGKITAIVGASGSGKTTLIKLLLGYYTPNEGNITIGGENLNEFNLHWWRKTCGVVLQDGFIFSESIARNIASSSEEIDKNRLLYAAKIANIDDFIDHLPLSYNTLIGQEGQGLSQGQKQRVLIARAVYKNPSFIFLDEATNALDANNEKQIVNNLNSFFLGKTVVIVAHRLSTVKNADQIIVLEHGKVVEKGNHKSLINDRGRYFELIKNQLELGN